MKSTNKTATAAQLLPSLVSAIQALHRSGELEVGQEIPLRCSCGRVILPPILVHENLKDSQRGILKAKVIGRSSEQAYSGLDYWALAVPLPTGASAKNYCITVAQHELERCGSWVYRSTEGQVQSLDWLQPG